MVSLAHRLEVCKLGGSKTDVWAYMGVGSRVGSSEVRYHQHQAMPLKAVRTLLLPSHQTPIRHQCSLHRNQLKLFILVVSTIAGCRIIKAKSRITLSKCQFSFNTYPLKTCVPPQCVF